MEKFTDTGDIGKTLREAEEDDRLTEDRGRLKPIRHVAAWRVALICLMAGDICFHCQIVDQDRKNKNCVHRFVNLVSDLTKGVCKQ